MRDTELCERLLGLKEPWRVKAVKMDVEGRRVKVEVECAERARSGRVLKAKSASTFMAGRGGVGGIWTPAALQR
jgi:hypothetical protein